MSKTHGGKGSKPRPIDRKALGKLKNKLWENLKKGKSDKELKAELAESGIEILTGLEQGNE
ncbi:MAG: hypothetical protein GY928_24100 [Colwellia sp.]|nr:hypothetical protein [Colwellia sp.]